MWVRCNRKRDLNTQDQNERDVEVPPNSTLPLYNKNDENNIMLNTSSTVSSFLNIENNNGSHVSPPISFDKLITNYQSDDSSIISDNLSARHSVIFSIKESSEEEQKEEEQQSTGQSSSEIDSLQYFHNDLIVANEDSF